jgi:hypothetical protein
MEVDLDSLQAALDYLRSINTAPLADVIWLRNGERVAIPPGAVADWKFVGLSNTEFARVHELIQDA